MISVFFAGMDVESSLELIERAQAGDDGALERLLVRYRPRLQRWASGRLPRYAREMTDTEDLVQEVLIGTVKNFKSFDQRGEWALQAYLRRAVTNRIRDELRRYQSQPRRQDLPEDAAASDRSPLELAVGREVMARYENSLQLLDEAEREAVIARVELGCSYQEIASLVDKPSPDAARMFVARALAKLAQQMAAAKETG
jgi:RNA polymerase sigma factor (sigma-70 family)